MYCRRATRLVLPTAACEEGPRTPVGDRSLSRRGPTSLAPQTIPTVLRSAHCCGRGRNNFCDHTSLLMTASTAAQIIDFWWSLGDVSSPHRHGDAGFGPGCPSLVPGGQALCTTSAVLAGSTVVHAGWRRSATVHIVEAMLGLLGHRPARANLAGPRHLFRTAPEIQQSTSLWVGLRQETERPPQDHAFLLDFRKIQSRPASESDRTEGRRSRSTRAFSTGAIAGPRPRGRSPDPLPFSPTPRHCNVHC